jgi:ATP-dependent Lon protease
MPILLESKKEKIMPIVAIRETVVFPHIETVLIFGRPKSVAAIEAAYKTDQLVCFFTQKNAKIVDPNQDDIFQVGTLAKIERLLYTGKEGVNAWIKGLRRVKLESIEAQKPFLLGKIVEIPEIIEESEETKVLSKTIMEYFQKTINLGKTVIF